MTGRSGISRATEGVWQEVERNFSRQMGRRGADGAQCESTREFFGEGRSDYGEGGPYLKASRAAVMPFMWLAPISSAIRSRLDGDPTA